MADAETLGNCRAGKADAKIYTTKLLLKPGIRISDVSGGGVSLLGPELWRSALPVSAGGQRWRSTQRVASTPQPGVETNSAYVAASD